MKIHCRSIGIVFVLLSIAVSGCRTGSPDGYSMNEQRRSLFGSDSSTPMAGSNGMAQARELERQGQTEEAIRCYAEICEHNPNLPMAWHRLGVAYDKIGQRQYADACYDQALALEPANAELWCDYGYGLFLQGEMLAADHAFRRALELNPELRRAHNNLGLTLARTGNTVGAVEQFKLAGCDSFQATKNLELAAAISIPARDVMQPIAFPNGQAPLVTNQPQSSPSIAQMPIAANQDPISQDPIQPPEIVEPTETPAPATEMPLAASQPITPIPAEDSAVGPVQQDASMSIEPIEQPTLEPIQIGTAPSLQCPIVQADAIDLQAQEKIDRLNTYAVDPSITLSDLPPPEIVSPEKLTGTEEAPKAFSKSTEKSFLKPTDSSERGVYTLITDLQRVRPSDDRPSGESTNVVRRIGDVDDKDDVEE